MSHLSLHGLYQAYAGILGALIGSFLNVVIYRLPRDKELAFARSACPHCGALIRWWENVPVLSWLYLRGRCRACGGPIHWRYSLVEALTALVFFWSFPEQLTPFALWKWAFLCAFASIMLCHLFIDLEHRLLLDKLNVALLLLVIPYALFFQPLLMWVVGGLLGFGGPFLVSWAFYKLRGQVGLGGGDIKLWGVLGVFLGPMGIVENIFFSCLLGSLVGIALIALRRYDRSAGIPFGPYIVVVSFVQAFFPGVLSFIF